MEIPNREQLETQLARRLERLNAKQRREVFIILGNPPQWENLDQIDWAKFERQVEAETMVAFYLIFMASANHHVEVAGADPEATRNRLLDARGAAYSRGRAQQFSKAYADGAKAAVDRAAAKLRAAQARMLPPEPPPRSLLGRGIDLLRRTPKPQPSFEIDQDELEQEINKALGPNRAAQAATNETTAAQSAGGEAGIDATVGISQDDLWINRPELSKTGPCPTCKPLHRTPRSYWSRIYPSGPGREVHDGCVCTILYKNTGAFDDGLDVDSRTPR